MGVIVILIKDSIFKKTLFIFLNIIFLFLIISNAYAQGTENDVINKHKKFKKHIIKIVKTNKDVFDDLVENVYSKNDEIEITLVNKNIHFVVNGKEEKLDKEYHKLYKKLFTILKCHRIRLHKNSSGYKIIEIYLRKEGKYVDSLIFCKDKKVGITNEITPGWYYRTLWYT